MTTAENACPPADGRHWPKSDRGISLGLMMPIFEFPDTGRAPSFEELLEMGLKAREVGFEALWIADHFVMGDGSAEQPFGGIWECWTLAAALAARVPDLQIGTAVSCTGFRNPGVIAKMTEMVDEISGGRVILGLGAGWHKPEYDQFGFPFDHRASRFEDAIRIIHPLLREGKADYQGEFFQANQALNIPRGPRPQGAPILVGSNGPRMLGLIASHADAWNTVWHRDTAKVREQIPAVDAACEAAGRDPATLVRTAGVIFGGGEDPAAPLDVAAGASMVNDFRELGFSHLMSHVFPPTLAMIESVGSVIEMVDAGNAR
ncbi:MAG: LLM class flavin-dependent oxidoreductase [Thermomicrobiales bacterium]